MGVEQRDFILVTVRDHCVVAHDFNIQVVESANMQVDVVFLYFEIADSAEPKPIDPPAEQENVSWTVSPDFRPSTSSFSFQTQ